MKQSKIDSLIEALVNVAIGFCITMIFSPIIYGAIHAPLSWKQMGMSTFYFTLLSIARQYIIRRWFNGKLFKLKKR